LRRSPRGERDTRAGTRRYPRAPQRHGDVSRLPTSRAARSAGNAIPRRCQEAVRRHDELMQCDDRAARRPRLQDDRRLLLRGVLAARRPRCRDACRATRNSPRKNFSAVEAVLVRRVSAPAGSTPRTGRRTRRRLSYGPAVNRGCAPTRDRPRRQCPISGRDERLVQGPLFRYTTSLRDLAIANIGLRTSLWPERVLCSCSGGRVFAGTFPALAFADAHSQ